MSHEKIAEAYRNGEPVSSICNRFGVNVYRLYCALKASGVTLRGRKLSHDTRQEIVSRYINGESSLKLKNEYGIDQGTVYNLLREHGLTAKQKQRLRESLSPQEKMQIREDYKSGVTRSAIVEKYQITETTLYRILRKNNDSLRVVRRNVNHSFFSEVDALRAYWIGFIAADGYVYKGKNLKVELAEKDKAHLEALRDLLTDSPLYCRAAKKTLGLYIASPQIVGDLLKYGIHQAKSATLRLPLDIPEEFFFDWLRGYYDGNGWPASNRAIGISSNFVMLSQLQKKLLTEYGIKSSVQKEPRNEIFANMNISVNGSLALLKKFYYPGCVCLDRKITKARLIFPEARL